MRSCRNRTGGSGKLRRSSTALCAMLPLCALLLHGCAQMPSAEPPQTQPVETTVSQDASDYSERARNWLQKAQSFLQEQ